MSCCSLLWGRAETGEVEERIPELILSNVLSPAL